MNPTFSSTLDSGNLSSVSFYKNSYNIHALAGAFGSTLTTTDYFVETKFMSSSSFF